MNITLSDFTGALSLGIIENSQEHIRLNEIIATFEPYYLRTFLGNKEYADYLDDNTTEKWEDFLVGKTLEVDADNSVYFTGFKEILKRFRRRKKDSGSALIPSCLDLSRLWIHRRELR